jgi:hypothetical protein
MNRLVDRLQYHLAHRDLARASEDEQKIKQADAKSVHKAKDTQAA